MGCSLLRYSVSLAAVLSGIAFIVFAIVYPIMINEIALIEEELSIHRDEFNQMSNEMWSEILQQSALIRHISAIERKKRQYGYSGYEGSAGGRGLSGGTETVAASNSCPAGPKGPPGDRGERGEDGLDGYSGKPGLDGVAMKPTSGSCAPCPPGPIGLPGYKGRRGPRGPKGQKGAQGKPGRDGVMGDEGPEGDRGYQGDAGPRGERGPPGKDGIKGGRGPRGPKGETGPIGPEGDEGVPGERGEDASAGLRGEEGPRGPLGEPGRPGPPGRSGRPGRKGADGEYCPCPDRTNEGGGRQAGSKYVKGRPGSFENANREDPYSTYDGNDRRSAKDSKGSSRNASGSGNEAIKRQQFVDERARIEEVENGDAESLTESISSIQTDQLDNKKDRGPIRGNIDAYDKRARAAALRRKHL